MATKRRPTPAQGRDRLAELYSPSTKIDDILEEAEEELIDDLTDLKESEVPAQATSDDTELELNNLREQLKAAQSKNSELQSIVDELQKKHSEQLSKSKKEYQAQVKELQSKIESAGSNKRTLTLPKINERAFLHMLKNERSQTNHMVSDLAGASLKMLSSDLGDILGVRRVYDKGLWNFAMAVTCSIYFKAKNSINRFEDRIARPSDQNEAMLELFRLLLAVAGADIPFELEEPPVDEFLDEIVIES